MSAIERLMTRLAGSDGIVRFQHEGPTIIRWLTGARPPDVYAQFEEAGLETIARCPKCKAEFGRFDAGYGPGTAGQLAAIREAGHKHNLENHA